MPLRDAILDLQGRLRTLRAALSTLAVLTERVGGGSVHTLVEQVDKSAVDALGWAKQAGRAVKRAARPGESPEAVRLALTAAQQALDQLRKKEPRRLRGRGLGADLADLSGRHERTRDAAQRRLGGWAGETLPLVRQVSAAARATDAAMAACWRELASRPAGRPVTVKTVTVVG